MNLDVVASFLSKGAFKSTGWTIMLAFFVYHMVYPMLNGTSYATLADVDLRISCERAPDSKRLIQISIRDLEKELDRYPGSDNIREDLEDEKAALKRASDVIHSPECNR